MYWNNLVKAVEAGHYKQESQADLDQIAHKVGGRYCRTEQGLFPVKMASREIHLTRREAECLLLVMRGKSMKDTGKQLSLSERTVEYYLNNVKIKFSQPKLKDLKQVAWSCGVNDLINRDQLKHLKTAS